MGSEVQEADPADTAALIIPTILLSKPGPTIVKQLVDHGLMPTFISVVRISGAADDDHMTIELIREPGTSTGDWHAAQVRARRLVMPDEDTLAALASILRARRSRPTLVIAGFLGALAGPQQQAWVQEWPAHLAEVEHTWRRPFLILWYLSGFAAAAAKWRLGSLLRGPSATVGRVVDQCLASDAVCGIFATAVVVTVIRLTGEHASAGAAAGAGTAAFAAVLHGLNQARKLRGIKHKKKPGTD